MPSGGADTATEAVTSAAILTLALEVAISPKMTRGTGWKQKGYVRGAQVRGQQKHVWGLDNDRLGGEGTGQVSRGRWRA